MSSYKLDGAAGLAWTLMTFGMVQDLQCILKAENTNYADSKAVILYSKEIK